MSSGMEKCFIFLLTGIIIIPFSYVFLINTLYDHRRPRNYPPNVLRRFFAAIFNTIISTMATIFLLNSFSFDPFTEMGFRKNGLIAAITFPTLLTAIFYTGNLATLVLDGSATKIFDANFWTAPFNNIFWLRNALMAPITEELSFRACSATLLRICIGEFAATFVAPISFSLSHLHHIFEDQKQGIPMEDAFLTRGFQMLYTYFFGIYVTHIFFQTGHIIAPILCHSICNLLEIPVIDEVCQFVSWRIQTILYCLHFGGFITWLILRPYLLSIDLYR